MRVIGLDVLGSDYAGARTRIGDFDWSTLFKAGGELTQQAVTAKNQADARQQAAADDETKLAAVVAADQAATDASATALMSADLAASTTGAAQSAAQMKASADAAVAQQMSNAQDMAAMGISSAVVTKRLAAATAALTDATKKAADAAKAYADAPNDGAKKAAAQVAGFRVKAAQMTALKAANAQTTLTTGRQPTPEEQARRLAELQAAAGGENFLTRKIGGVVPVWGAGLGILGLVGGFFGVKHFLGR